MIDEAFHRLDVASRGRIVALALALVFAIAIADYFATTDVDLITFYWLPVSLLAWYVGFWPGAALGAICAAIPTIFDLIQGRVFARPILGIASTAATRVFSSFVIALLVRKLRQRTDRLQATAAHLRAFNYSIAHDLRSPVRTITVFAELVSRKESHLGQDARHYLGRIVAAGLRLQSMLEGLLLLSHVSSRPIRRETVDLGTLARHILTDLEQEPGARPRSLIVTEPLDAAGDKELLTVLMHDLLDNAWKFTGRVEAPRIEVGAVEESGQTAYFVRDNGEGFDPASAAKIFEPFHRLPGAESFPGQGIGLATASRIVAAHGGRIWAEGSKGRGAAFFFTLEPPS